jgi:hypothetical protein
VSQGSEGPPWYWSLRHNRVEGPKGDPNDRRLGPFATREEAERALQTARERSEAWDNDPRWND